MLLSLKAIRILIQRSYRVRAPCCVLDGFVYRHSYLRVQRTKVMASLEPARISVVDTARATWKQVCELEDSNMDWMR